MVGAILLGIWRKDDVRPRFAAAAAALGIAGLAAFAFSFTALPQNYRVGLLAALVVPESEAPKTAEDWRARATDLIAKYPRDPRPRYFRSVDLIDANDMAAAERELRAGLAEFDLWRQVINPEFAMHMKVALAVALAAARPAEAREVAKQVCPWAKDGPTRQLLNQHKLCGE